MKPIVCFFGVVCWAASVLGARYYVSVTGNDSWPGTQAQPFRTIQHAADGMRAGDDCIIRQGIYPERVRPVRDGSPAAPITFRALPHETVIVTGADELSGWSRVEGDIYRAPMSWDLGTGENQLFVDGVWAHEARWPNIEEFHDKYPTRDDRAACSFGYSVCGYSPYQSLQAAPWIFDKEPFLRPTLWGISIRFGDGGSHRGQSPTPGVFECWAGKNCFLYGKPDNYWVGTGYYDPGWWFSTGAIIASSRDAGDSLHFTIEGKDQMRWCGKGFFYGKRDFIDSKNEWALDNGYVYMQMPAGAQPATLDIRAKKRHVLFDLRNRTGIHLNNIVFHGGSVHLDSAYDCVVDKCHFKYLSHYWAVTVPYNAAAQEEIDEGKRGIVLGGSGNVLKNGSIEYSASNGVVMRGSGNTVTNNWLRVMAYVNSYDAAIQGLRHGDVASHNTIDIVGRSAINGANGGTVQYNHFKDCMALSGDGGVLYTWGSYPLYMDISYNWFDNMIGRPALYLYCDAGAYAYIVHHNVFMPKIDNNGWVFNCYGGEYYNNTWVCTDPRGPFEEKHADIFGHVDSWGISKNDLVATDKTLSPITLAGIGGQRIDTTKWHFTDPDNKDYSLRSTSPAINAGVEIPGTTNGHIGAAPDLGAYEYGKEPWRPGHDWGEMPQMAALWNLSKQEPSFVVHEMPGPRVPDLVGYNAARKLIVFNNSHIGGTITILDVSGRVIEAWPVNKTVLKLSLSCGMYRYVFDHSGIKRKGSLLVIR